MRATKKSTESSQTSSANPVISMTETEGKREREKEWSWLSPLQYTTRFCTSSYLYMYALDNWYTVQIRDAFYQFVVHSIQCSLTLIRKPLFPLSLPVFSLSNSLTLLFLCVCVCLLLNNWINDNFQFIHIFIKKKETRMQSNAKNHREYLNRYSTAIDLFRWNNTTWTQKNTQCTCKYTLSILLAKMQ